MAAVVGRVRVPQPCSPNAAGRHRCDTFDRFTYEDAVSHPAWCEGAKAINIPGEAGPGPQQEPGGAQGPGQKEHLDVHGGVIFSYIEMSSLVNLSRIGADDAPTYANSDKVNAMSTLVSWSDHMEVNDNPTPESRGEVDKLIPNQSYDNLLLRFPCVGEGFPTPPKEHNLSAALVAL
ncbi:hypothetical protein OsJ_29188 [Oryza sativa Japonica Group]|uniref:Uncharacterized protein n=1 Tax=Oryza sativa subsp. japonica TaxID=39947 RepID=A3BYC8_ORYSJ|nr:hypothetical protein OsJ_29188 [Oryza sativa Japonica Group]